MVVKDTPRKHFEESSVTLEEQQVQIFARQMLLSRVFVGHYQERRYVELLQTYRDVIAVSKHEVELRKALHVVRRRVSEFYNSRNFWVGITGPQMIGVPSGYCLWTTLNNVTFGKYWFRIKQVKFTGDNEMILRVKCISPVDEELPICRDRETNPIQSTSRGLDRVMNVGPSSPDVKEKLSKLGSDLLGHVNTLELTHLLYFLSIFAVSIITATVHFVWYVGEFSVKLFREFNNFIYVITPVLLAVIEFLTKCIGGFYILILGIWRSALGHHQYGQRMPNVPRPLQYRSYRIPKQ